MTRSDQTRGTLMVVGGVLILSVQGLLIRQVSANHWTLICWRGFFTFISLLLWLLFSWRSRTLSRCLRIGWPGVVAAGILAVANILFLIAFTLTSIANTLIFADSVPLLAALLSWLVLREKVPVYTWIAIITGLAGIGVIFHGSITGGSWIGDLCAFGTAVSMATYLIFVRSSLETNMLPALTLSGIMLSLVVLPFASPFTVNGSDLGLLFIMGGIIFPLGMGLVTTAPRYIPATEVGLLILLEAVFGSTWAWLLLAESPGLESLLGGILVIGSLVFNSLLGWKYVDSH